MLNLSLSLSLALPLCADILDTWSTVNTSCNTFQPSSAYCGEKRSPWSSAVPGTSCGHIRKICHNPHAMCQSPTSLSLSLCDEVSKQPPSVCYIGHDALSTKFLFQTGDDGQVACDDIIMPTITPKRPRALPKISITKIFTNREEFCASDNAQLLPMIPTHSPQTRFANPTMMPEEKRE
jgi:hypothetical protein